MASARDCDARDVVARDRHRASASRARCARASRSARPAPSPTRPKALSTGVRADRGGLAPGQRRPPRARPRAPVRAREQAQHGRARSRSRAPRRRPPRAPRSARRRSPGTARPPRAAGRCAAARGGGQRRAELERARSCRATLDELAARRGRARAGRPRRTRRRSTAALASGSTSTPKAELGAAPAPAGARPRRVASQRPGETWAGTSAPSSRPARAAAPRRRSPDACAGQAQRRGRVGRAAAEPGGDRDPLVDASAAAAAPSQPVAARNARSAARREVLLRRPVHARADDLVARVAPAGASSSVSSSASEIDCITVTSSWRAVRALEAEEQPQVDLRRRERAQRSSSERS